MLRNNNYACLKKSVFYLFFKWCIKIKFVSIYYKSLFDMKPNTVINDTIDQIISDGVRRGILHLYTDDDKLHDNQLTLKGIKVTNFGSCSYLGLEFDPRLKEAS